MDGTTAGVNAQHDGIASPHSQNILRGRKEIANYARMSIHTFDKMIDRGYIKVFRVGELGVLYTTKDLVERQIENLAEKKTDDRRR